MFVNIIDLKEWNVEIISRVASYKNLNIYLSIYILNKTVVHFQY